MAYLKILWDGWKKIALKIGDFQTTLIFSFIYFIFITPLGLVISIFVDFLEIRRLVGWHGVKHNLDTINELKLQ